MCISVNKCNACDARYLLKSSLQLHDTRLVIDIRAYCRVCECTHRFRNRCQYWNHIRRHERDGDKSDVFSSIQVSCF